MSKYLYNGIELPALPAWDKEKYPYASIADDGSGYYYLDYSAKPTIVSAAGNVGWGGAMYMCKQGQTDWVRDGVEGIIFPTLIWANYDAYYADSAGDVAGTLYLPASDPVPVPDLEWQGKDIYLCRNGQWVRCEAVRKMDGAWVKMDAYGV